VPAFIPKLSLFTKPSVPFSIIPGLRREYSGILATVAGFIFIEALRNLFEDREIRISTISIYVLGITILYVIIVRTLKKTGKLNRKDLP
jgi:hypothetical protein